MQNEKKLFLLDAFALIFRAYYAFINRPIRNSKGQNTSAVYGFINSLDEILRKEKPSHIAVAFDHPSMTFRHKMFKDYKANRQETPEDIKLSVPYIKKVIEAYNIPILELSGYEADDIIGTIAKQAEKEGFTVYMMTPDKDYAQLVSEHILMYKPSRSGNGSEIWGVDEVCSNFAINDPIQVIDILALWGDTADNIPGAPGIGEKTSKLLIEKYGSVENLLASTADLKGKQKDNLENNIELIKLSKTLVTIDINVPIDVKIEALKQVDFNRNKLEMLFNELEFNTIKARILGSSVKVEQTIQRSLFDTVPIETTISPDNFQVFDSKNVDYKLVESKFELKALIEKLKSQKVVCFDTETTGLNVFTSDILGVALSWKEKEAYYVSIPKDFNVAVSILKELSSFFTDEGILKVGHNIKYDMQILARYGIVVKGSVFDTMVAHYLINPESKHKLDRLTEQLCNYKMIPITDLIGEKGKDQITLENIDIQRVKDYACEDADLTFRIYEILKSKLEKNGLTNLANTIEMPLIPVLSAMELAGFTIDIEALLEYDKLLLSEILVEQDNIYKLAGEEFNIASPKQLGLILFEKLKIADKAQKTKTKQYSTGEEILQKLIDKHEIVPAILEYRSLTKLQSTYVSALPKLIQPETGKIHTSLNQTIAATGRLSSINPNLQNIPIREERGRQIRKSFIASSENHLLVSADYSQIELRIMAHLSDDCNMIEAFSQGADIHRSTAAKIYKIEPAEVSSEMRSKAKTANFGIIYGISVFGLSQRLNIPRDEAKELIDNYFLTFPGVQKYMETCILEAKETGYVSTMFGRKRYLPDINAANSIVRGFAERNAINSPIQGSAADIIKLAMIQIQNALDKNFKSKMILQVHDELIFDVHKNELDSLKAMVKDMMENVTRLKVPLLVEMGEGISWLDAH